MQHNTPEIKEKLKELEGQFSNYKISPSKYPSNFSFINLSSHKFYAGLLGALLFLLILFRPSFLYVHNREKRKVFSFRKLLMYWIIFFILIIFGIFIYNYKTAQP